MRLKKFIKKSAPFILAGSLLFSAPNSNSKSKINQFSQKNKPLSEIIKEKQLKYVKPLTVDNWKKFKLNVISEQNLNLFTKENPFSIILVGTNGCRPCIEANNTLSNWLFEAEKNKQNQVGFFSFGSLKFRNYSELKKYCELIGQGVVIDVIPTTLYFKNGVLVHQTHGYGSGFNSRENYIEELQHNLNVLKRRDN